MPERFQLKRSRDWRMPEGALKASRGTHLGNPFRVYEHCKGPAGDWGVEDTGRFNLSIAHGWTRLGAIRFAIDCYRQEFDKVYPPDSTARKILAARLANTELIGCWCAPADPCHVDYLIEVAGEADPELVKSLKEMDDADA
ncbi:DUF4326 domain-containing protein [Microbacterium jejuense]|uniref:DUF4326 domain-containing protein n=1 Tax=Microbacterium jejuense TaxID=1263637 RepID=UPI0031F11486